MLPTSGYFRGIPCPEHERNYCHRPYCHFRHNPKKEMTDAAPQSSTSTPDVEVDGTSSSHETLRVPPTSSNTETETVKEFGSLEPQGEDSEQEEQSGPNEEKQSELLQHLVSEAVKKVLAENPLLSTSGIDPSLVVKSIDTSALAAHAAAEVTQANTRLKKKYYFRPPDTPSYNPTPIEELNKRKRSVDYNEDVSASKAKALKYTPAPFISVSTLQDATESEPNSKESVESEVTDFSSDEADDDVDKRKCDFDILEEVLAEHSQNNKIRVKKKKVKALGKLQYSLNIPDKKVDESSMISDARNMSDQDSNSCDMPVTSTEDKVPNEGSYFLPPSPVFTSSSDGFGAFSSVVYTKPSTSPKECESSENRTVLEKKTVQNLQENSEKEESTHAIKQSNLSAKAEKKRTCKDDTKKGAKGHTHLPQVVHTLGAPKLSRPNIRNWTPQVRSTTSDSKREGDTLEEMLQFMDGNDASNKEKSKESSKNSPAVSGHHASPKNRKKYKVDLDKEIESLTNSSSTKKGELTSEDKADLYCKESNKLAEASQRNESEPETKECSKVGEKSNVKKKLENETNENEKNPKMDMNEKDKPSESDTPDTESEEESNDGNSIDKKTADDSDSEHERKRHKKRRKRSPSSSFESDHSHHRKKRKKYHKRRRKHSRSKKRRKHRDRKSHSSDNDEELMKDGKDDDDDENKSEIIGDILKDENDKTKKGKKHKKKNKHKKSKYKRKKSKSKPKKKNNKSHSRSRSSSVNRSHSSSSNRSRSSSGHRSRSSSKYQSRSSSGHRSRSSSRHRSRCLSNNRSKSPSKGRSENSTQRSRSRSRSRNSYTCKPRHKGECDSKSQNESSSKHRSRSSSRSSSASSSKYRSRSVSKNRSKSPSKSRSENPNQRSRSHSRSKNSYTHKSRHRGKSDGKSSSESSSKDRSRSSSRNRSRSSSKHRSRSLSKNRSKSPSKDRGENINRSRSHSRSKSNYGHKSQHRREMDSRSQNESSSKHRSRSSSRHRSRSSSNCRSENVSKNRSQSPSKGRGEKTIRRSRSCSRSKVSYSHKSQHRRGSNAKTQSGSNLLTKESHLTDSQLLSTPMPIDPSKIKVEKELVPDLSLVKTEKLDTEESSDSSFKKDKVNNYSEVNTKSNNVDNKKMHSGNQKSSREATKELESSRRRDKEHFRLSADKESKRRDSHERKNSTDSISEKSSTSNRRCSIDSKKSDNEISLEKKKLEDRRTSTEKNKKEKVSSPKPDSQPKDMSMFDLVMASTQPPKPKSLTEISIFEAVSNMHDENTDSSSAPSDDEEDQRNYHDFKTQKHSTQEVCSDQKHNVSHSIVKSKSELSSKIDKINDHPKSETARHSHRSNDSRIDSSSKGNKSESKHSHSLSTKDKKYNHHISSSSHHGSNSGHHKSGSGGGSSSSSKQHPSSSSSSKQHPSSSSSSKRHPSGSVISSSTSTKTIHSSNCKSKEGNSDISSSSHFRSSSKHSSSKHHHSSKSSSSKHISGSQHKDLKDKRISSNRTIKSKKESKTDEMTKTKKTANIDETMKGKKVPAIEESSDGISDRDLYGYNDTGNESPLPDLSVLDEIPEDDWEQMISSSDKVDSRDFENLENYEESDIEDLDRDDPQVMEECMKMFNDYHPVPEDLETQPSSKKARMKSVDEEPDPLPGKQRISRSNSTGNLLPKKPNIHQHRKTPAQMMMERYKKLKEQQAKLMKQLEKQKQQLEEQSRGGSSSAISSTTSAKPNASSASSSTSIMSPPHSSLGGIKRRISHVPNVSSLLTAREKIKNLPPPNSRLLLSPSVSKASGAVPQTHAQTVSKGEKRVAHTSRTETLARPVIQAEFGSKVPQNIRQRYLNLLIDECLKFCGEMDAFNIAAAEECVCVKRASSRMVYLNLAVNAVKRLRTQQKAGEAAQELLDKEPQFAESLSVEEPSTSSVSSSPSKDGKPHPTNPNHVKLSHFTVLAGGGQKGSWSIEKPKKNSHDIQDSLKGEAFYKHMMKYIMTEDQLAANGYPCPDPDEKGKAIIKMVDSRKKISPSSVERYCDRCSVLYVVDKWGFPTSTGPCVHHWGRAYKRRSYGGPEARYSCCGGDLESEGCCQAVTHVSQNFNPNNLHGYVRTLPKDIKGNDHGVYALDCEMCYTTGGNELTRVTVVNTEGNIVYEHLVKPENPIIDYNTRFSGITESDLQDVKTTLLDVQAAFLTRFSDKTVLIGHSLESDFQALKLIHDTVVDTSIIFPHKMGAPYKRALRNLASEYLKKIIQNDVSGHDSAEDATTCMHLMQWKLKEDIKEELKRFMLSCPVQSWQMVPNEEMPTILANYQHSPASFIHRPVHYNPSETCETIISLLFSQFGFRSL